MMYLIIDILGAAAFAISGVLVAMDKKLDFFGVLIIAFVTATGGGTLRDVLVGNTPVFWMLNPVYLFTILGAVILAIIFVKQLKYLRKTLFLFDTIGLGLFTMVGIEKGLAAELIPPMCIVLGTITASFGGVIRDILCNDIPVIFHKEIYATPSILGGICYFLLSMFPIEPVYSYMGAIVLIIVLRLLAVKFHITLPNIYRVKK
ncbi:trimeric intracellular cation channel family protein [Maribacter polysaccharolyticus]|uniref:trimeric intracellular cation channel family protein n=1 Tax=Maribacter polysaccharolyticus TaxID=3020831 RepID=UPI00237F9175|nr:trimeric intracellular cation channel family protein [Maribacter polysaccharolyticus]MDE3741308.1 trimeric intracellular cation channel family protein [Maribacter polysaccharolyticus]